MTTRPDIPYDGPATGGRCRARGLGAMFALLIAPVAGMAQSDQQMNDANNPLTPTLTANLQDQWAPQLYDSDNSTNALLLRGVLPHLFGGMPQILRATLPIATAPSTSGSGNTTGLGDLNLFDLALFKEEGLVLGIGPQLTLPTASDQALGTGKWQAGLAAVAIAPQTWGLLGGLVTWQHSFAGKATGRRRTTSPCSPSSSTTCHRACICARRRSGTSISHAVTTLFPSVPVWVRCSRSLMAARSTCSPSHSGRSFIMVRGSRSFSCSQESTFNFLSIRNSSGPTPA